MDTLYRGVPARSALMAVLIVPALLLVVNAVTLFT